MSQGPIWRRIAIACKYGAMIILGLAVCVGSALLGWIIGDVIYPDRPHYIAQAIGFVCGAILFIGLIQAGLEQEEAKKKKAAAAEEET